MMQADARAVLGCQLSKNHAAAARCGMLRGSPLQRAPEATERGATAAALRPGFFVAQEDRAAAAGCRVRLGFL